MRAKAWGDVRIYPVLPGAVSIYPVLPGNKVMTEPWHSRIKVLPEEAHPPPGCLVLLGGAGPGWLSYPETAPTMFPLPQPYIVLGHVTARESYSKGLNGPTQGICESCGFPASSLLPTGPVLSTPNLCAFLWITWASLQLPPLLYWEGRWWELNWSSPPFLCVCWTLTLDQDAL